MLRRDFLHRSAAAGALLASSAVAKRYHTEIGSDRVMTIFAELQKEIRISQLSFVEVQSVFAMKVRSGFLDRKDAGMQRARFLVDVAAGDIEVLHSPPAFGGDRLGAGEVLSACVIEEEVKPTVALQHLADERFGPTAQ